MDDKVKDFIKDSAVNKRQNKKEYVIYHIFCYVDLSDRRQYEKYSI